jgi:hypothetical protein
LVSRASRRFLFSNSSQECSSLECVERLQLEIELELEFHLLQERTPQLCNIGMFCLTCYFDVPVDGQLKCEKWIRDDDNKSEESKMKWWVKRLIGRPKDVHISWPYPFAEGKLFVMTLTAGLEGYHVNVDGRHVASFLYRTVSLFKFTCVLYVA